MNSRANQIRQGLLCSFLSFLAPSLVSEQDEIAIPSPSSRLPFPISSFLLLLGRLGRGRGLGGRDRFATFGLCGAGPGRLLFRLPRVVRRGSAIGRLHPKQRSNSEPSC